MTPVTTEQIENGLFEILRRELGEYNPTFGSADDLSDDEDYWHALVDITFPAYRTDDGMVTPKPITMEFRFDKESGDYLLITGEDNEHEITKATIFACAYFYSWQAATALQAERTRELEELHPSVIAFAKAMQHKLDKNKHKDGKGWERNPDGSRNGWAGCSVEFLVDKLREEVSELLEALEHEGLDEIRNEAADVGNIAMMLADVCGSLNRSIDTKEPT